jgi:hypothetical protein
MGPTGNTLLDLSGCDNRGTLTNMDPATDWVAGPDGWALDLDGSNDYAPISPQPDYTQGFTIIARARLDAYAATLAAPAWGMRNLIDTRSATYTDLHGMAVYGTANGVLHCQTNWVTSIPVAERAAITSSQVVPLGTTFSAATTASAAGAVVLYYEGMAIGSANFTGTIRQPTVTNIGRFANAALSGYWDGQIDAMAMWARVLSAAEVATVSADPLCFLRPRRRWWAVALTSGLPMAEFSRQFYQYAPGPEVY